MSQEKRYLQLIESLQLEPHLEGGWFRRTFQSDVSLDVDTPAGRRPLLTSIYYLLTRESPVGHFHRNSSGIMHYFHEGDSIDYFLLDSCGQLQHNRLGWQIEKGDRLQLYVPGGVWKASRLCEGESAYGLISEAVAPGFDFADMELGTRENLQQQYPAHSGLIRELCREL